MLVQPTKAQLRVLKFVLRYCGEHGFAPSLREISEGVGIKGTITAAEHLAALQRKGLVNWERGKARAISPTDEGRAYE